MTDRHAFAFSATLFDMNYFTGLNPHFRAVIAGDNGASLAGLRLVTAT